MVDQNQVVDFYSSLTEDERENIASFVEANRTSSLSMGDLKMALNNYRLTKTKVVKEDDKPLVEKLRGKSLVEKEKILTEVGLWKNPRSPFAPEYPDRRESRVIRTTYPSRKPINLRESERVKLPSRDIDPNRAVGAFDSWGRDKPHRESDKTDFEKELEAKEKDLIKKGFLKKPVRKSKYSGRGRL